MKASNTLLLFLLCVIALLIGCDLDENTKNDTAASLKEPKE
jgi:hypothetical protein